MRASRHRIATTIVVGLLVAACASTTSPAPVTTPTPTLLQTPPAPATPSLLPESPRPTSTPPAVTPAMGRIAAGYQHTCAITSVGWVKCWGANQNGQLGNGTTGELAVPGAVDVSGPESGVSAIAAGSAHTCALTSGGGVRCWGSNEYGQLGNGSNADSSVPVDVVGLAGGVSAISAGEHDTCALTRAGGVKCWGWNPRGQLGDGTSTDRNRPVAVEGLASGITAVSAGTLHTCALTSGGGVTCWGFGPAVDPGLAADSYIPVSVPNLASGVTAIAAGLGRTCARRTGGGTTCWGPDYAPPSGKVPRDWMVRLDTSGLSGEVSAIAAGESHVCALTTGGGVACWGDNSYGQLGHLQPTSDAVPVEVPGFASGVTAVTVGGQHTCALTNDDAVRCWGSNRYGQLGSVTRCTSSSAPVDVPLDADAPTPPAGSTPSGAPIGRIEHATGSTDVVLRFDRGPDFAVGDLVGELFQPGPEFTLYGDGTVIFRNEAVPPPPPAGTILRARPFKTAQLDEEQVQSLVRFALGEGGLGDACERYETRDSDVAGSDVWILHAGGLDKRVVDAGSGPFAALRDDLRNFDRSGIRASVWVPDRFWGNLLDASVFKNIGDGVTPGLAKSRSVPWPWPDIAPAAFVGLAETNPGRRVMSADEAAVLGLSKNGGVVQRIYLRGPNRKTIYYFSLWPMLPDETG